MSFIKHQVILTPEECDTIAKTVLSLEDDIKQRYPDEYIGTPNDSLTGRYKFFNFLNNEKIGFILRPKLKELFGPCVVQCWANIFRNDEGIETHSHVNPYTPELVTSANIFVHGDPNIGTYYGGVKHVNKLGEISIFSPNILHHVPKNQTNTERITIAMDIYLENGEIIKEQILKEPYRYVFL
jgi:hypothetical protein